MAAASVAADLNEALDVECDISAKVAFNAVIVVDLLTQLCNLVVGEVLNAGIGVDTTGLEDVIGYFSANTVDVSDKNYTTCVLSYSVVSDCLQPHGL